MARKNSKVRARNNSARRRSETPIPQARTISRIAIDDLVLPDGECRFRLARGRKAKARFATEEKAARALRQAQANRARLGSGHVEKRYYACPEGGCGGYHLSSREEFEERPWVPREEQR